MAVELEGAKTYKSLNDPNIVLFYMKVDEKIRTLRMRERGDDEQKIQSRLINDRTAFALNDEMNKLIDVVVDTEHHDIVSVSKFIYDKYISILKERNIQFIPSND